MTEEVARKAELIIPHTGEIVPLDDPIQCALARDGLTQLITKAYDLKRQLTTAIEEQAVERGSRTIRGDGWEVTIKPNSDLQWDMTVLKELLDAGLPKDRYDELVIATVEYKVSATVARQIGSINPKYQEIIDRALTRIAKAPDVSIKPREEP